MWGRPWQGEGWIPLPGWAGESCVALLEPHLCAFVVRQVPGDSGSCSGAGWLPPLWLPSPTAAGIVGEEAFPGGRKVLCPWRKGLISVLFFNTLATQGWMCATQGKKLLLCFAPAEFQGKALGKPKGKCGEEGDASICISYLSCTRVYKVWAGDKPVTWNGLLGMGSSYPADPNLGVNPMLLRQGGGEPWLLWSAHLRAAASAPTFPAAPQGLCW